MIIEVVKSALFRVAVPLMSPLLLAACLYSVEPVLDETNSTPGEKSAEYSAFLKAGNFAFGNGNAFLALKLTDGVPENEGPGGRVPSSSTRVVSLEGGVLLVQEKMSECISDHCFGYLIVRMREPWWPEQCYASTGGDNSDALLALAADHEVKLSKLGEAQFVGMEGTRENMLSFLRAEFTKGGLVCTDPPLHLAAQHGALGRLSALIEAGADVNARANGGKTPLHYAANPTVIDALIKAGADVNALDNSGATPLHYASSNGSSANVNALLDAGADGSVRKLNGETPLEMSKHNPNYDEFRGSVAYKRLQRAQKP